MIHTRAPRGKIFSLPFTFSSSWQSQLCPLLSAPLTLSLSSSLHCRFFHCHLPPYLGHCALEMLARSDPLLQAKKRPCLALVVQDHGEHPVRRGPVPKRERTWIACASRTHTGEGHSHPGPPGLGNSELGLRILEATDQRPLTTTTKDSGSGKGSLRPGVCGFGAQTLP